MPLGRRGRARGNKKARSTSGAGLGSRVRANSPGRSPGADEIEINDDGERRVHVRIIIHRAAFVKAAGLTEPRASPRAHARGRPMRRLHVDGRERGFVNGRAPPGYALDGCHHDHSECSFTSWQARPARSMWVLPTTWCAGSGSIGAEPWLVSRVDTGSISWSTMRPASIQPALSPGKSRSRVGLGKESGNDRSIEPYLERSGETLVCGRLIRRPLAFARGDSRKRAPGNR